MSVATQLVGVLRKPLVTAAPTKGKREFDGGVQENKAKPEGSTAVTPRETLALADVIVLVLMLMDVGHDNTARHDAN